MTKKKVIEEIESSEGETDSESIEVLEKPIRKSSKIPNEIIIEKPKRVQSEKQKESFAKARAKLLEKTKAKRKEKEEEQLIQDQLKAKLKAKKDKKKEKVAKQLKELSSDESSSEEEVIVKKRPKQKIVYVDNNDIEKHKPIINIYNHGKDEESKPVVPLVRKSKGIFL